MSEPCSIDYCAKPIEAGDMCHVHNRRARDYGSPHRRFSPEARFMKKVDRSGDCWEWLGAKTEKGYPHFYDSDERGMRMAHRASYKMHTGPIPEGMEVDHACRNRGCVNPDHLRLATRKQNMENLSPLAAKTESGLRGVTRTSKGRWCARVGHNKQLIHIGVYDTMEEAAAAVVAKRLELHTYNLEDRQAA